MNRTTLALILVVAGIALAIVSGLAHLIGLSFTASGAGEDTFGWKQVVGVVAGVAIAVSGVAIAAAARRSSSEAAVTGPDEGPGG